MKAKIIVALKNNVLDPQGKAIEGSLKSLGISDVKEVRQGKVFFVELNENDPNRGQITLNNMCEKLLANTVIEDYSIEVQ